jgi:hypothetical protein
MSQFTCRFYPLHPSFDGSSPRAPPELPQSSPRQTIDNAIEVAILSASTGDSYRCPIFEQTKESAS